MNVYVVQAFNRKLGKWVRVAQVTGTPVEVRDAYRRYAAHSNGYTRALLAGAPEGANVVYGSASEDPHQAAIDHEAIPYEEDPYNN
jgi:hypothetical protein